MKHSTKFWRLRQGLLPILLGVLAVGGLLLGAQPASAQQVSGPTQVGQFCMQRVFTGPQGTVNNNNRLNCTANDVRIAEALDAQCIGPNCFDAETCIAGPGKTFDLLATFRVIVTSNERYDTAYFFRIDGGANARGDGSGATGLCSVSQLDAPPPTNPPVLDLDGDTCGDLNAGTYDTITFRINGVACADPDNDGFVNLPNCTSWHSNQGTLCTLDTNVFDANPDTKSKCVCDDTFQVPIHIAAPATITVDKSVQPESVPADTGGSVEYTVTVVNPSTSEAGVEITSLIDDLYGNLNGQGTCVTPFTLAIGATFTCKFTKTIAPGAEGTTVDDEVCAAGTDENDNDVGPTCDDASVRRSDVLPTARAEKAATAFCTDVTYQVKVFNTSALDPLTLNSLNDTKFGNITSAHAAGGGFEEVVDTTCATGGTIPVTGTDNPYVCTFVGRICGTSNTTHTNTVEGGLTDDENNAITTDPDGSATVIVNIQ